MGNNQLKITHNCNVVGSYDACKYCGGTQEEMIRCDNCNNENVRKSKNKYSGIIISIIVVFALLLIYMLV